MSDKTELQSEVSATEGLSSTEGAKLERLVMFDASTESWETKNNCKDCNYKKCKPADDEGFCYMFKDAPDGLCMKHSELEREDLQLQTSLAIMCLTL